MISAIRSHLRFRIAMGVVALAIVILGFILPGIWPIGFLLGLGANALLLRFVGGDSTQAQIPPSRAKAIASYVCAGVFAFVALVVAAMIARAVRTGSGAEETILGIGLGTFVFVTYRFYRWGRDVPLNGHVG